MFRITARDRFVCRHRSGRLVAVLAGLIMLQSAGAETEIATVTLTTHRRSVNGTDSVPRGLFGVHAMNGLTGEIAADWGIESIRTIEVSPTGEPRQPGTGQGHGFITHDPEQIIECWYDRYRPALLLSAPENWQKGLRVLGQRWASSVEHQNHVLEFWNEPYLNWAANPGVNGDGRFYEDRDGEVWRNGQRQPNLKWIHQNVARRLPAATQSEGAQDAIDYLATRYMPRGLKPGDTFGWRKQRYQVAKVPWVKDTLQPSWWSGPYNRELYHEMVGVLGPAMQQANPDAKLVVGWGFHLYQDGWQAWDVLHRPLIDHAAPWMYGYNEHHYGGDARAVAGSYEVAWAYALAKHGKRIKLFNTEAGGFLDGERPNAAARSGPDGLEKLQREVQSTAYMLRDVIHLIDVCPDKAASRAAHMPDTYGGEAAFKLLKPLRGKLLRATSSDANLWTVASVDGRTVCLVIFNDYQGSRKIALDLKAWKDGLPEGICRRTAVIDGALQVVDGPITDAIEVEAKQAVSLVWQLDEPALLTNVRHSTQYVADEARVNVKPGEKLRLSLKVPAAHLANAESAHIKLVQAPWLRPGGGGWQVTLNGEPLRLNVPPGGGWIATQPIDLDRLQAQNTFEFSLAPDADRDAAIDALSIELHRVDAPSATAVSRPSSDFLAD